jgi:hypothetical protein
MPRRRFYKPVDREVLGEILGKRGEQNEDG